LDAELTTNVAFGNIRVPKTTLGKTILHGAIGFGGVQMHKRRMYVVARSWVWPLLMHVARLEPAELEELMIAVVTDPPGAQQLMSRLKASPQ
jgi:hypothetical protein